jgi:hypothetical protein
MVNLLTGDFSYKLDLIEVPGPEGSFTAPLFYQAGIGLEQEASWVGLGWNINVGSITRSIAGFPDDSSGEDHIISVNDPEVVRGWSSSLMGLGYLGLGSIGWNTQVGHYGQVSLLGLSWAGGDFDINYVQLGITVLSVLSVAGAIGAIGAATSAKVQAAASFENAVSALNNFVTVASSAQQLALSALTFNSDINAPKGGAWDFKKVKKRKFLHTEYKIVLDDTRTENMFGVLYLQNADHIMTESSSWLTSNNVNFKTNLKLNGITSNFQYFFARDYKGAASDIGYSFSENELVRNIKSPAAIASDNFTVNANSISGSITPYRLDVGSVAFPRRMTEGHMRLGIIPYINYKVPFVYEGLSSNQYFHHVGGLNDISSPSFYSNLSTQSNSTKIEDNTLEIIDFKDINYTNRIRADVNSTKNLPYEKHIHWLTNKEISKSPGAITGGFMDYFSPSDRTLLRTLIPSSLYGKLFTYSTDNFSNGYIELDSHQLKSFSIGQIVNIKLYKYIGSNQFSTSEHSVLVTEKTNTGINVSTSGIPSNFLTGSVTVEVRTRDISLSETLIGGFSITNENGYTYHFSIPTYEYSNYTKSQNYSDESKNSTIMRTAPFATTWLLTGITGPDFVDRGGVGNAGNGMIDETDWGYWMKFNYSLYAKDVKWRAPFNENDFRVDEENNYKSFSQGYKQLYYLNSIESRSHIGLFLKSQRQFDGINIDGIKSLQLDEFVLLSKENFNKLNSLYGIEEHRSKLDKTLFTNSIPSSAKLFIDLNAEKIVKFNYSNLLCKKAPGTTSNQGKLTLESVSVYGRNRSKLIPDYQFEYGFNPEYKKDHWDGWGYYSSEGTSSGTTHIASTKVIDPSAYSLTKIKTPMGSELNITYEPDTYSSIAGVEVNRDNKGFSDVLYPALPSYIPVNFIDVSPDIFNKYKVGDRVRINGQYTMTCNGNTVVIPITNKVTTINGASSGNFRLSFSDPLVNHSCTTFGVQYRLACTIEKEILEKFGGGVRVKELFTTENNIVTSKIKYSYKQNELNENDSHSSGVISKEPPFIKKNNQAQPSNAEIPGFPTTPVLYGKVTVRSGLFTTPNDYHSMQSYSFITPNNNMIINQIETIKDNVKFNYKLKGARNFNEFWNIFHAKVSDYTSAIGSLENSKVYQNSNNGLKLVSETINQYSNSVTNIQNEKFQGVFSQGNIMYDNFLEYGGYAIDNSYHKIGKTTFIKYPNFLVSVTTIKDGLVTKNLNNKWDFFTSRVLDQTVIKPNGLSIRTITKPAYHLPEYAEFGSKAVSLNNKNQMAVDAATYTYLVTPLNQVLGLLSAEATTFKKDWNNYRVYNSSTGLFENQAEGPPVWREDKSYAWLGNNAKLKSDGTFNFTASDEFKFAANSLNPGWKLLSENVRVNHSSSSLESKDYKGFSSINILGHNNKVIIAQVANAQYGEATFSSAEDLDPSTNYFGGEVARGSGTVKSAFTGDLVSAGIFKTPHTGDKLLELNNINQTGFIYRSNNFKGNKKYKAAVWTNNLDGRLYYKAGSSAAVLSSAPIVTRKSGEWYLLEFIFTTPSVPGPFEVGVTVNSNQVVWFDDFKVQPFESTITCNVYPSPDVYFTNTNNLEMYDYVLSNDHLYTKSVYSANNKVEKVFVESFKHGGEKLVSESKEYFRRNQ